MPRVVLLAIDWSEYAEKAFDWYVQHLHRKGTELVLSHYIEAETEKDLKRKREALKELQEFYEHTLDELKIKHTWSVGFEKSPSDHILWGADDARAEMIIMGARGLGKLKRAILGSCSDTVIRKAKIPVLICKW